MGFQTEGLGSNKVMVTNVNQAPSTGAVTSDVLSAMSNGVNYKAAYTDVQVSTPKQFPATYYGFFLVKVNWGGLNYSVHQIPFQDGNYSVTCLPSDMFSDGGNNLYAALININGKFITFTKCGFKNTSTGVWNDRMTNNLYTFSAYTCTQVGGAYE